MEFANILPSPEMGSWLSEEFDQDFCYGAKASTYQNPVFAITPSLWALDDLNNTSEWTEQTKNLNELSRSESFPDVILQENFFGGLAVERSDKLYDDNKFYDLTPEAIAASPIFEHSDSPPESPQSQKLPTIKIKLKRVKRPKAAKHDRRNLLKENSKKFKFEVVTPPTGVISKFANNQYEHNEGQPTLEWQCQNDFPFLKDEACRNIEYDIFPIDEHFQFENSPVSGISLHDAFDTGEADDFLDELLNNTVNGDNSAFKIDLEDNFIALDVSSPLSSINSFAPSPHFDDYSESEMSPSTLETIDESLISPTKEMFDFLEVGTSKQSNNSHNKQRPNKQSDKSRYLRKKEQNKQAAIRYRMKKKQEDNSLSNTMKQEEEHQEKLKIELSNLTQEINIMKNLLREAFVVKKLVPENYFSKKTNL